MIAKAKRAWTPKRIEALRLALKEQFGWTQAETAAQLGFTGRQWNNWETGRTKMSISTGILLDFMARKLADEKTSQLTLTESK